MTDTVTFEAQGPIQKDKLFLGVAGLFAQKDGYIENTVTGDAVNDKEKWFGRGTLRWTPTMQFDLSLILSRLKFNDGAFNMTLGSNGAALYGLPAPQERQVSSNLEGSNDAGSNMQALKMTYDFSESLTLTSISSHRVYDDECMLDYDFSSSTLRHSRKDNQYRKISQEMRLNYAKNRLKWLLGVYYDDDHNDINYETESIYPTLAGVTSRDLEGDAYAVFGNISLPLTERLNIFSGLRYEKQNLSFRDNLDKRAFDDSWDAVSPRVGIEYHCVPDLMFYGSVSKGYRSGGFNMFAMDSRYYSYEPESLWNYEVGVKGDFFDHRLVVNGALYYMDISDMATATTRYTMIREKSAYR
ncbi:TonB-dependent receptor domain-containing protein [uncultured Desulfobacter sp.]|uniref:TonB-dependent receptor domain-containing protein n=1 Tax=uncultured Desulfobacter sp. TaxID=240139 RepID=UPI0037494541